MRPLEPLGVALEGTLLVEASAGTGKTHTITTLVVRLVVEKGLPIDQVLVVTFTEAATAELRDRVRRRLVHARAAFAEPPPAQLADAEMTELAARARTAETRSEARARIQRALEDLDLAGISTIHSFCRQALEEHAFESGARFDLDFVTDLAPLVQDIADDHWATQTYELPRDAYELVRGDWTHEKARSLVSELARRPAKTRVLPAATNGDDTSDAIPRLRALFEEAGTVWKAQEAPILRLLGSGALNANSYPLGQLDGWAREMSAYFAAGAPFAFPDKMGRFGQTKVASSIKNNQEVPRHRFFGLIQELLDEHAGALASRLLALKQSAVAHTHRELARRKAQGRMRSFDDLLTSLDAALHGPHGEALAQALRRRYAAALIDEFQDTDPVQYRIFRAVFHGQATLLLVGDPKQSIYAFRGADVFSYFGAATDAGEARYTLTTSYRSDPSLVRAVNAVFSSGALPFVFEEISFPPITAQAPADRIAGAGPAFELLLVGAESGLTARLPALVAGDIARLLRSGATLEGRPVVAGDVAVLTRSNNQASDVQEELRALGIASVLETEASVFESPEARDLESVLHAIAEPNRAALVKTALATELVGMSADRIAHLETDEEAWDAWSERFRDLREVWQERGFIETYRRLLHLLKAESRLLALIDGERRLTNLSHLAELLHRAAIGERLGMVALLQWFGRMRADEGAQAQALGSAASEIRLESDAHAVKLLTVHKSKGLEYAIVYCPYLWWTHSRKPEVTAFHDPGQANELTLHLDPDAAATERREREAKAEDQRLLYVALTRAKHKVHVVWRAPDKALSSSLAYALHRNDGKTAAKLDEETLRASLRVLAARAGGAIGMRELVAHAEETFPLVAGADRPLRARSFTRKVDRRWRMTSFSALTKDGTGAPVVSEEEERDRDELEDAAAAESGDPADTPDTAAAKEDAAPRDVTLADFPRGSRAGTMLHAVFELHDFTAPESELRARVETTLTRHGYDAATLAEPLTRGVREILATPLDATGRLSLGGLARSQRLDELEFVFPVAAGKGANVAFARARLAEVFARHPSEALPARYADHLRALDFGEMRGFLRGFVDLVFEHEERFYVVDYKSNHLGRTAADYGAKELRAAMTHADYYLQYHLYVVALHRHLARRMRGYSYERSIGGVYYLFARGMAPGNGQAGVFFERPPEARIEALSRCLDGLAHEDAHV